MKANSDNKNIDSSYVDQIIVNIIKEMTQAVMLDKIYDKADLGKIMRSKFFKDSCIRHEFSKTFNRSTSFRHNNNNRIKEYNNVQASHSFKRNKSSNEGYQYSNNTDPNSGQIRNYNNNQVGNNYNNYGFTRNSGQYRQTHHRNYDRPTQNEPMEVENRKRQD
ncbi:glycosyltransferase-like protein gnt13 [Condylostylus longicornis]|uniref:glycosyltransferase-like protein gnt13 n=1 Tax=Condylostylus longicornis TaxID=2530218 RepID=UPI00244DB2A6|nr:glycosyltransferase-like protein gnt13 [Condylostylus longicornis]